MPNPAPAREPPYVYVLVRNDLGAEQRLVQVGHAALEAGFRFGKPEGDVHLVVLGVDGEEALMEASSRLDLDGIDHHLFFEPDFGMGHSALATRPVRGRERRRFGRWELYRGAGG